MEAALNTLRIIRSALMASIFLYVVVGEVAGRQVKSEPNVFLFYALSFIGVALVALMFIIRRVLVLPSEIALARQPADEAALNRWRTGYVVTYALSESLGLIAVALRIMGFTLSQVLPLYVGGFVLLAFFGPRRPSRYGAE